MIKAKGIIPFCDICNFHQITEKPAIFIHGFNLSEYISQNPICFQGEEYEKRVPLIVEPKPDYIKRVFMTFKLLDEKITLPLQDIEQFKIKERKGFFVFEWGGSQIY